MREHYIRLDVSEKTFLAICKCGWRSDCLTSEIALRRVVENHRMLGETDRKARYELHRPRRTTRP